MWSWGKKEIIYLSLHCHHQNDSCIKMGSDESHFNVSLIVRDKVTRQYPQTTHNLLAYLIGAISGWTETGATNDGRSGGKVSESEARERCW